MKNTLKDWTTQFMSLKTEAQKTAFFEQRKKEIANQTPQEVDQMLLAMKQSVAEIGQKVRADRKNKKAA